MDNKYDYIHIKEVLHHVTGKTVSESNLSLKNSILRVHELLEKNGILLIHEEFYEGYLIQNLQSYVIFYLLKIQNRLKIKLPVKEFILGLDVYFYTRKELKKIIEECGFEILDIKVDYGLTDSKKELLLIKNWGRILIIAKKVG